MVWTQCYSDEDAKAVGLNGRDDLIKKECIDLQDGSRYDGTWKDCGSYKYSGECKKPDWSEWVQSECQSDGSRKYYSKLNNIGGGSDNWIDSCNQAINFTRFSKDDIMSKTCINKGQTEGMWGEVFVKDPSCTRTESTVVNLNESPLDLLVPTTPTTPTTTTDSKEPYWGDWKDEKCTSDGISKKSSQLLGIEGSWEDACDKAIQETGFSNIKETKCVNRGVEGMWGEVFIKDPDCDPKWTEWTKAECTKPGIRKNYAKLNDIRGDWDKACEEYIEIPEFSNVTERKCKNKGSAEGQWGEIYTKDPMCNGAWGTFTSECGDKGVRRYFSKLAVPQGLEWMETCNTKIANPTSALGKTLEDGTCVDRGIDGVYGEWVVEDPECVKGTSPFGDLSNLDLGLNMNLIIIVIVGIIVLLIFLKIVF